MSLRVWLPLTKDLRNQGLDDVTVTNNGATFSSAGKLGGTYEFASGKRIQTTLPPTSNLNSKAISFACWINISSWNSSYDCLMSIADGTSWVTSRATLCRNNTDSTLCWSIADGNTSTRVSTTTSLSTNTWYHIACTYDGASLKIYVNGALDKSAAATLSIGYAGTFNIGSWLDNNYPINGKMNDIRVYNHCLSPMEVKELSKGLVLHYPLNRGGWGQENLAVSTATASSTNGKIYNLASTIPSGTKVTISCWIDADNITMSGNKRIGLSSNIPRSDGTGTQWFETWASYNNGLLSDNGSFHGRASNTQTILGNMSSIGTYIQTLSSGIVSISQLKVEIGDGPTPWCPNSSDALATTMGFNDTTEYDCSGFCNNGTRTGTFSWTSDTPKYNVSTNFEAAANIIEAPGWYETNSESTDFSIATWVKTIDTANCNLGMGLISLYSTSTGVIQISIHKTDGSVLGYKRTKTNGTTANQWCHIVAVYSEIEKKIYIYKNGVLWDSFSIVANIPFSATYKVQCGNDNGALLSDYRVYATALSADDVKSLYQNSAYIDNSGNVYGAVHSEV